MTSDSTSRPAIGRVLGIAAVSALLLSACANPAPSPSSPTADSASSGVTAAAIEHLGASECDPADAAELQITMLDDLLCGKLTVPIDRNDPASPMADLTVVLTDGDRPRGAMLLIGGGPGGSATWSVPVNARVMGELAEQYQFIAVDVRGTGLGALDCPEVQAEVGSSDILAASRGALDACAEALGPWIGALSTTETVADLDDLRAALGLERWVLDGTSYGTYVAARYAMAHPEAVEALILDSVVPPEGVDPFLLSSFEAIPGVLQQLCEAMDCPTDPLADLEAVLESGYDPVALFNMLVAHSVAAPAFPGVLEALAAARDGDRTGLDELVAAMQAAAASRLALFSAGTHVAVYCLDTPMPWGDADDPAAREAALVAAIAAVDPSRIRPFSPAMLAELGTTAPCIHWPAPSASAPTAAELAAIAAIPTVTVTGELDLSTPLANALALAGLLDDVDTVSIPWVGHAAQHSPGAVEAITDFLLRR